MFDAPEPSMPTLAKTPDSPTPPPMFGERAPQGKKPKARSSAPTYLGQNYVPQPGTTGQKTLMGQ